MAEKTYKGNDLQRGERLQIMLEGDELRAMMNQPRAVNL